MRNKLELFQKNNQGGNFLINKNYLEILNKELTDLEKDECKILISDYLNDESEYKKIHASNANQLFFIIDFLIDYIKNKEKKYKKEMTEVLQENKELIKLAKTEDEKYKKINEVIKQNNLRQYFRGLIKENNEIINSYDKISTIINNKPKIKTIIQGENLKKVFLFGDDCLKYNPYIFFSLSKTI